VSVTTRELDGEPSTLRLYLKAALPALPVVGAMPGIRHLRAGVPDLQLTRTGVRTDPSHLAAYADVCGFSLGALLPATYPHLAAFGLQLTLMCDTAFPFAPMGMVHLRNSITQYRPLTVDDVLDVGVSAADLRPHPKGRLIHLVSTIDVDGSRVWEETMTLLTRGSGGQEYRTPPLAGLEAPAGPVRWRLPSDLGRRYAAVAGDRNPIHLYALTAKAFGFPRQIAHGMWAKARCLSALEGRLPRSYRVDVEFQKPMLLPASVTFGSRPAQGATEFGIQGRPRDGHPLTHLVGRVTPFE